MKQGPATIDPFQIFFQAHGFFHAQQTLYGHLDPQSETPQPLTLPALVLSALASELFLKCLIAIETNANPPTGHDLYLLFKKLSLLTRQRLTKMWDWYVVGRKDIWDKWEQETGYTFARELPSALKLAGRSFEFMRYRYEKPTEHFLFYLDDLPHMLGCMALELRPDWHPAGWQPQDFDIAPPNRP
jgi:HEPN domain-containing protein